MLDIVYDVLERVKVMSSSFIGVQFIQADNEIIGTYLWSCQPWFYSFLERAYFGLELMFRKYPIL